MARRFRFQLEVVQTVRRRARDAQQRVVAARAREVAGARKRIAGFERRIETNVSTRSTMQRTARLDVVSLREHHAYRGWLLDQVAEARRELSEAERKLQSQQAHLAEAAKQLKVIEKLRDRQWQRHCKEVAREERAETDETAVQAYWRRRAATQRENPA